MISNKTKVIKWCDIAIEVGFIIFILVQPIREHTATIKSFGIGIPLLAWIIKIFLNKKINWKKTPLDYPFTLFILVSLLSIFFSVNFMDSILSFKHFLLKFIFIYFILVNNIKDDNQIKRVLGAIVAINIIYSSIAVFNYASGFRISTVPGASALSLAHISLGKTLVITIPVIGIFYSISKQKMISFLFAFFFLLSITAILLTFSRSSWLAFIASLILWGVFKNRRTVGILLLSGFLYALFVAPPNVKERIKEGFKKGALQNRPAYWEAAINMIKDKPLTGFGYGSGIYRDVYQEYRPKDAMDELPSHVHNTYIAAAVESGIFGFFTLIWILMVYCKETIKCIIRTRDDQRKTILIGILVSLFGFMIIGLVEIMFINHYGMYFWILAGIAMSIVLSEKTLHKIKQDKATFL